MARGRKSSWRIASIPRGTYHLATLAMFDDDRRWACARGRIILLLAAGHSQSNVAQVVGVQRPVVRKWAKRFLAQRLEGLAEALGRGAKGFFPPRWPSTWCVWPANAPIRWVVASRNGIATNWRASASRRGSWRTSPPPTVRRILRSHKLKPWRGHVWLHPKKPRDAVFYATVSALINLYTRPLHGHEMVLSVDEKTSLQPRPRQHPTLPAQPQNLPNRCEHEYKRAGALNLFAAFDTRSGTVYGPCDDRKRQQECIAFLEHLDRRLRRMSPAFISCVTILARIMAKRSASG